MKQFRLCINCRIYKQRFRLSSKHIYEDIKTLDNGLVIKYKCKCNDIVKIKNFEIKFNIGKNINY